jgi:hypothetical protein
MREGFRGQAERLHARQPVTRVQLGLLTAALALVCIERPAQAGCLNLCDLTVEPTSVTPALGCLFATATPNSCDCSVDVLVVNSCAEDVQAKGFAFDACRFPSEPSRPAEPACAAVAPHANGSIHLPLRASAGTGAKTWSFALSNNGADVTLDVHANVAAFRSAGCAFEPPRAGFGAAPLAAATVLILLARRRRRA